MSFLKTEDKLSESPTGYGLKSVCKVTSSLDILHNRCVYSQGGELYNLTPSTPSVPPLESIYN